MGMVHFFFFFKASVISAYVRSTETSLAPGWGEYERSIGVLGKSIFRMDGFLKKRRPRSDSESITAINTMDFVRHLTKCRWSQSTPRRKSQGVTIQYGNLTTEHLP